MSGSGDPILLIHGNGANTRIWGRSADDLAAEHLVIAYDRRGFGRSPGPPASNMRDHVADAAALLRRAGRGAGHRSRLERRRCRRRRPGDRTPRAGLLADPRGAGDPPAAQQHLVAAALGGEDRIRPPGQARRATRRTGAVRLCPRLPDRRQPVRPLPGGLARVDAGERRGDGRRDRPPAPPLPTPSRPGRDLLPGDSHAGCASPSRPSPR